MGDTIIELKKSFLNNQIRILNAALEPPRHWRDNAPVSEQGEIKEKVIQEVLHKLNTIVRHHNRTVYSSQAVRHVAEQIDRLYWASGSPDPYTGEVADGMVDRGADFRDHDTIIKLPDEWPGEEEGAANDSSLEQFAESTRYKQLQARLLSLNEQREAQKRKLAQYKHLQQLLQPFKNPQENIQPNLVTKDGELSKELERMKLLMARAGEKLKGIQGIQEPGGHNGDMEGPKLDSGKRVAAILESRPTELG